MKDFRIPSVMTTIFVAIIIIASGLFRPMPVEASGTAQPNTQPAPRLVVLSVECESHIRIRFSADYLPPESEVLSYGEVSFTVNGSSRAARFVGRTGASARYNEYIDPINGVYTLTNANVTIATTNGELNLNWPGPQSFVVSDCQNNASPTPTQTLTPTETFTPTSTVTSTLTPSETPTGTLTPSVTPDLTITATPTDNVTPTLEITPSETQIAPSATPTTTVTTPEGPKLAQCGWVVPVKYIGHAYIVRSVETGEQFGNAYPHIEYKPEGPWVWVMFDVALSGLTGEVVSLDNGDVILSFTFLADGLGNDDLGNCYTELEFPPTSDISPTATPIVSDSGCVNCGPPTQERIPAGGILEVDYALCTNLEDVCNPELLRHFKVFQGEVNFALLVNGTRVDATPVTNVRGTFYVLDGIDKWATTQLINPDGSDYTGPFYSTPACSIWPTFARLDGDTMTYWSGATRSNIAEWLEDEFDIPYHIGMEYANRLSQKPYQPLALPQ
jgi:hypothetical protein